MQIADSSEGCQGSFVASVGLDSNRNVPDAFFVVNSKVFRIDYRWESHEVGSIATGSHPTFAETGGERPLLLIADGFNLWYYDLKNGGSLRSIGLPNKINQESVAIKPASVQVVAGSIIVNDVGSGYAYYSIPYPLSIMTNNFQRK